MQESIQLQIQLKGFQDNEEMLKSRIAKFKTDHPQLISKEVELTRLERTARIHEKTYILLMDRYEETRLLKQMETAGITVIDKATAPPSPIKPNKRLMITFGILIGLTVGVGAAFFLEYTDDSLKIERDIEKFLGMSVVGVIPKIEVEKATLKALSTDLENGLGNEQTTNHQLSQKRKKLSKRRQKSLANMMGRIIINLDSKSPVTESYRALRTNIQFANADGEVKTILVSSAGPGEGKTLTTSNLAITMARMGTKTLLVDADLRRPRLHSIFQQEREPGLSTLLISEHDTDAQSNYANPPQESGPDEQELQVEEARFIEAENIETSEQSSSAVTFPNFVRTTEIENLYLLPSGKRPPNPSELLGSDRMQQLMEKLKSEFEIILFDSPPIIPVTDASVLAASEMTDIVLLVVRSGETKREVAQKAQELLDRVDANVFGVVLNTIDYAKQYGSYYYYYYHYYYSHDDEEV